MQITIIAQKSKSLLDPHIEVTKLFQRIKRYFDKSSNYKTNDNFLNLQFNKEIQKLLDKSQSAIHTIRANWLYLLTWHPFVYKYIYPVFLKKEEDTIEGAIKSTIAAYTVDATPVIEKVSNDSEINKLFSQDPQAKSDLNNEFIHYIARNPNNYNKYCPAIIRHENKDMSKFQAVAQAEIVKRIQNFEYLKNSISQLTGFYLDLEKEFKNPETKKYLLQKTIEILENSPEDAYGSCLNEFKKLPEVIEALTVGWVRMFSGSMADENNHLWFLEYIRVPPVIKNDPRIIAIKNDFVKKALILFLNENFKKLFPEPQEPFSYTIRREVEMLLNEFKAQNYIISLFWKMKEKAKGAVKNSKEKMEGNYNIKFNKEYSCTIIKGVNTQGDPEQEDETFPPNEVHEVDVIADQGDYVNVQFGDGSVLNGLKKTDFDIVPKTSVVNASPTLSGSIKIMFKHDYECVVLRNNPPIEENELFHGQDIVEVTVINDHGNNIDVRFGDGSVLMGLGKEDFDVIPS